MASTSASTPLATLRLQAPLLIVRTPDNPFLNAPLLELLTVLDVAIFSTMMALKNLRGRGVILLRSIIGFLTLLLLLGAEDPLILVLRTILPYMVDKIRVLGA